MKLSFSFIVPVYNRPDEILELLESLIKQTYKESFEVVIVEDGSNAPSDHVVDAFRGELNILYLTKENTGPGDSRNYGMQRANGDYFIILDSDCVLPESYLDVVSRELSTEFMHCYGGPDAAHESFSDIQKAINYSMTSLLTTGGIRGNKHQVGRFQPRSFNMGLSKEAFEASKGFGKIHPGEDPDLVLRLWKLGYNTKLIGKAFVYHKRRISWAKFKIQVKKFGMVRPILNTWHPDSKKITYWFPTVFVVVVIASTVLALVGFIWFLLAVFGYCVIVWLHAALITGSLKIASYAVYATLVQFFGYGLGFLRSTIDIGWKRKDPRKRYPHLFFD